jgi:hypothetical protein
MSVEKSCADVTIVGNTFRNGGGGDTILVADNIFRGPARDVAPADGCTNVEIRGNLIAE